MHRAEELEGVPSEVVGVVKVIVETPGTHLIPQWREVSAVSSIPAGKRGKVPVGEDPKYLSWETLELGGGWVVRLRQV